MDLNKLLEVREHVNKTLNLLDEKILEYDWRHLINRGYHSLGVRAYYKQNDKCNLKEAMDACDAFRNFIMNN